MARRYKPKSERYDAHTAPPAGVQAQDARTVTARKLRRYQQASDAEQFDFVKDNLAQINFYLSEEAVNIAKGTSQLDISKMVQICTALGISYDKLYAKRDTGIKVLAFPAPLLGMVRKGLLLSKGAEVSSGGDGQPPSQKVEAAASTLADPPQPAVPAAQSTPVVKSRYKTPMMQQAHDALCPSVPSTVKPAGVNPRSAYLKQYREKRKQGQDQRGDGLRCDEGPGAGA